jgi:capsular polysaccharide biosynthesis protein
MLLTLEWRAEIPYSPPNLSSDDKGYCAGRPKNIEIPGLRAGRSVAQSGSALYWGCRGRGFESRRSDQIFQHVRHGDNSGRNRIQAKLGRFSTMYSLSVAPVAHCPELRQKLVLGARRSCLVTVDGLIKQAEAAVRSNELDAARGFAAEAELLAPRDPLVSALKVHIARRRRSRGDVREIVNGALSAWFDSQIPGNSGNASWQINRAVAFSDVNDHAVALHHIDHVEQVMTDLADQPSARPTFLGLSDTILLPRADWSPMTSGGEILVQGMGINPRLVRQALGGDAPKVDATVIHHPDQRVIVIGTNDNWFHFILDYLPRLLAVLECGLLEAGWRVALGRDTANLFQPLLELLGVPDEKVLWLDAEHAHHFSRAVYISNMGLRGIPHAFALALLRRYLLPKVINSSGTTPDIKRVFVSRTDTVWRRLHNEEDLHEGLMDRGFEIIHPARLSLRQQMEIFRPATLVAGVHGSGLVNAVWCAHAPMMIEISPLTARDTHFSNLVKRLGGKHWRLRAGRDETVESGANRSDFSIDTGRVFALIDQVIAEMETQPPGKLD